MCIPQILVHRMWNKSGYNISHSESTYKCNTATVTYHKNKNTITDEITYTVNLVITKYTYKQLKLHDT